MERGEWRKDSFLDIRVIVFRVGMNSLTGRMHAPAHLHDESCRAERKCCAREMWGGTKRGLSAVS